MTTDSIITARGLTKTFAVRKSVVEAVTDLDLEVARGELVAFLGPNGAGKSTSLRMLTTLLPPTSGSARVAGYDIATQPAAVRSRIGYIGQGTSGGHNQRVRDELLSQGAFYGMTRRDTEARADELLESLDLAPYATRKVLGLSGGQKRRLDIALGLIHSPELLFLDEPSTGLDPQSRANLWQHILDLRKEHGTTVFVTTHFLEEADQFAERVLVMDHGRMIADDTAGNLKSTLAGDVITLGFARGEDARAAASTIERITGHPGEVSAGSTGGTGSSGGAGSIVVVVDGGERILPALLRAVDTVTTAALRQPTLDDVFLALTGRSLREESTTSKDTTSPKEEVAA